MVPTILFIGSSLPRFLKELSNKYSFIVYPTSTVSPFIQRDDIIKALDDKRIDGVMGLSDDTSILASLLAQALSLPGINPEALYKAQNKQVFFEIVKKICPDFPSPIVIHNQSHIDTIDSVYPAFLKPIKGITSLNAFKIHSHEELVLIMKRIFPTQHPQLAWFKPFFDAHDPTRSHPIEGYLLQPFIDERQFTVDGFVYKNKSFCLGITESIFDEDHQSFLRFDYPAVLSHEVQRNLYSLVQKIVSTLNYDNGGFNMEFYVTRDNRIIVIELNTRIAMQFIPLLHQTYADSPINMMLELALGTTPNLQKRTDGHAFATSYVLRTKQDKLVVSLPSQDEVQSIIDKHDLLGVEFFAEEGKKLSDFRQDPYTFRYAKIDIGRNSKEEINDIINKVKSELKIILSPV